MSIIVTCFDAAIKLKRTVILSSMLPSTTLEGSTPLPHPQDMWVFAYGSLIWNPGFPFEEKVKARVYGLHRALCIYSLRYRGTDETPGLVLGLDRGGSCLGYAFRVSGRNAAQTRRTLAERELVTHVYKEVTRPITLDDGRVVAALCYLADNTHKQYAGRLTRAETVRIIRQGYGEAGSCTEYVMNTLSALAQLGIKDHALGWLGEALDAPL